MAFTQRHYIVIASMLSDLRREACDTSDLFALDTLETIGIRMADHFERDNPQFNRARFFHAVHIAD